MRPVYRLTLLFLFYFFCIQSDAFGKEQSVFFNARMLNTLRMNCDQDAWADSVRKECVANAAPWLEMSDDALWSSVFGPSISRSFMVWSDGFCPSCKNDVKMYDWIIDPFQSPWKVRCPHCSEFFPKNDFEAYYLSGMNLHSIFDPDLADEYLLYHAGHSAPNDPKYGFGVDDGEGFVLGNNRWRFIGTYLIYGQWKKLIIEGVRNLANAYAMTGNRVYAHKTGILLDRIADIYPEFDYSRQGFTYEMQDTVNANGYVSVWHDACMETRSLALAYDMIYDCISHDGELVEFLSNKANVYKIENPKTNFAHIQRNIETGILKNALDNRHKIESNFPQTDITIILIKTILGWSEDRGDILDRIDAMISRATAMDGLSGEKGLASYSAHVPRTMTQFLGLYDRLDESLLKSLVRDHPNLIKTYRFHIDTWIDGSYYPKIGDTGRFAEKTEHYAGAHFSKNPLGSSYRDISFGSNFTLFEKLFKITGDTACIQVLYTENGRSTSGMPYDLFEKDAPGFQERVRSVIQIAGETPVCRSVNFQDWCLALLRSNENEGPVLWLDYDIGGNHCHADGLNIGLFAKGLDILPGFGYPPVQYGGWFTREAVWYRKTAAHNTVVIDEKDQMHRIGFKEKEPIREQLNPLKRHVKGETKLWSPGRSFQAIRVNGGMLHEEYTPQQFERTLALVDIGDGDAYVFDHFRVRGGSEHVKFVHGYMGEISTYGLQTEAAQNGTEDYLMNNLEVDMEPEEYWHIDWKINDHYGYLENNDDVHLIYRDVTRDAEVTLADTWIAFGFDRGEGNIKSVMIRREGELPLASAFTGVLEPYTKESKISRIRRFPLRMADGSSSDEMDVALSIDFVDGRQDLIIAREIESAVDTSGKTETQLPVFQSDWGVSTDAEMLFLRRDQRQNIIRIAIANGSNVSLHGFSLKLIRKVPIMEIEMIGDQYKIAAGDASAVAKLIKD